MMNTTQMKAVLTANMSDIRILSIQLYLTELIEREKHGDGMEQYRIVNTNTGDRVTSLTDLVNQIDPDKLHMAHYAHTDRMAGDRTNPTVVILNNFKVELSAHSKEDSMYTSIYGAGDKRIMFLVNYISDGDEVLPLKIFSVRLV